MVTLTEYPSLSKDHKQESNKSYKRAITKTSTYLEQSKLKANGEMMRFGAVHGGKNTALLSRSLEQIMLHEVDGLVVCDVCEEETLEEREEIYRQIGERVKQ
jgi:tRNA-guanine family transglycosylase